MSVLSVADAKTYLNITAAGTDDEVQVFIDSAESVIARHVGPLAATEVTVRVRPTGTRLAVPTVPAVSLTSVTPADGSPLNPSDLYLDAAAGVVTYNSGAVFGARYYTVVYSAGRTVNASTNPDLYLAVKELVRHLWATQRGTGARSGGAEIVPGAAYTLPNRVLELLAPHLSPGFA